MRIFDFFITLIFGFFFRKVYIEPLGGVTTLKLKLVLVLQKHQEIKMHQERTGEKENGKLGETWVDLYRWRTFCD